MSSRLPSTSPPPRPERSSAARCPSARTPPTASATPADFRYFGGALPFVELGTDTEPPYTATFDSTEVANTGIVGGTLYAVAHDAAGHTTTVGNAVTIDNT